MDPLKQMSAMTPHGVARNFQRFLWEHFALKRQRVYLAGFLVGAFGGIMVAIKQEFHLLLPLVGGILGLGATCLITLMEGWQARITADRLQGKSTVWKSTLFVLGGLLALLAVTVGFGSLVLLFIG